MLIASISVFSQTEEKTVPNNFSITLHPFYATVNGMRLDFDYRLGKSNSILVFAPQLYLKSGSNDEYDYKETMSGFGANVYYKYVISDSLRFSGPYIQLGVNYQSYTVEAFVDDFYSDKDYYGLETIEYRTEKQKEKIMKLGPDVIFGWQLTPMKKVLLDVYVGTGLRYRITDASEKFIEEFNYAPTGYAFQGIVPLAGFRAGVVLF